MTRTIGGQLDYRRLHFWTLDRAQQAAAVRRLAAAGWTDHDIARLVGWHVDEVRRAISEAREVRT